MATCKGAANRPCQFASLNIPISEHDGQNYCLVHLPLDATKPDGTKKVVGDVIPAVTESLRASDEPIVGAVFPSDAAINLRDQRSAAIFSDCHFAADALINLKDSTGSADFVRPHFGGKVVIGLSRKGNKLKVANALFPGEATISFTPGSTDVDLSGCEFQGGLILTSSPMGRWNLSRTTFHSPLNISIDSPPTISQSCTFSGATFRKGACSAETESTYRKIRRAFENNGDRDNEGLFYAAEKRSQRMGLPHGTERAFSAVYDATSGYGRDYARALQILLWVQVLFAFFYSLMSGRLSVPGRVDTQVLAFTLSNVVRPFEVGTTRQLVGIASEIVGANTLTPAWIALTTLHSVMSLVTFGLFLLALRWRFKRA